MIATLVGRPTVCNRRRDNPLGPTLVVKWSALIYLQQQETEGCYEIRDGDAHDWRSGGGSNVVNRPKVAITQGIR